MTQTQTQTPIFVVGTKTVAGAFPDRADAHSFTQAMDDEEPILVEYGGHVREGLDRRGAHKAIEEFFRKVGE